MTYESMTMTVQFKSCQSARVLIVVSVTLQSTRMQCPVEYTDP